MVEYGILGPLTARVAGQAVDLGGARQRAVLAVLLLSRNTVVSIDRLLDLVWSEDPPPTAEAALQNHISRLRRLLGSAAIETRSPGYALRAAGGDVDVEQFQALVERAQAATPREAGTLLRDALGLWRGPALADLAYEPFAEVEIARLEELRLGALEARIEADLASGRHEALTGELEALVAEHPYRERLHGQRILALYRAGRQAKALAAYREARTALDEGLGIDPGPELQALEVRILQQDPTLVVPTVGVAAAGALAGSPSAPDTTSHMADAPAAPMDLPRRRGRRVVTILCADLVGSTALGEQLDPETLESILGNYAAVAREAITRHGRAVETFVGDAVVAVFGVPTIYEDDALRAVRAAFEFRDAVGRLIEGLALRVGINTGEGTSVGR